MNDRESSRSVAAALTLILAVFPPLAWSCASQAGGLTVFRESPADSGAINPGDFKQLGDALQGKIKVVDIVNFGRLRFLSWPARRRLSYAALDRFPDFIPVRPPAALEGYEAPVVERVAPLKVQFALRVKSLNKMLESLGSAERLPAGLEGRTFTLSTAPELRLRYRSKDLKRRGDLVLSETQAPLLEVPAGVDLNQLRAALLALPLWPEPIRRQFAALPVGADGQVAGALALDPLGGGEAERVEVNGNPGIFLFLPSEFEQRLSPQALELRRQAGRQAEESGDPWVEHHRHGNTLLWRQKGLLLSLTGEGLTLAQAKAIAELMR
ncbi:MAG: hypothetical protein QME79_08895 [Bacillota bacterium]|nr:hypothetical protein [Bacillota bacterium]